MVDLTDAAVGITFLKDVFEQQEETVIERKIVLISEQPIVQLFGDTLFLRKRQKNELIFLDREDFKFLCEG